jgi:hypothetical protein
MDSFLFSIRLHALRLPFQIGTAWGAPCDGKTMTQWAHAAIDPWGTTVFVTKDLWDVRLDSLTYLKRSGGRPE